MHCGTRTWIVLTIQTAWLCLDAQKKENKAACGRTQQQSEILLSHETTSGEETRRPNQVHVRGLLGKSRRIQIQLAFGNRSAKIVVRHPLRHSIIRVQRPTKRDHFDSQVISRTLPNKSLGRKISDQRKDGVSWCTIKLQWTHPRTTTRRSRREYGTGNKKSFGRSTA